MSIALQKVKKGEISDYIEYKEYLSSYLQDKTCSENSNILELNNCGMKKVKNIESRNSFELNSTNSVDEHHFKITVDIIVPNKKAKKIIRKEKILEKIKVLENEMIEEIKQIKQKPEIANQDEYIEKENQAMTNDNISNEKELEKNKEKQINPSFTRKSVIASKYLELFKVTTKELLDKANKNFSNNLKQFDNRKIFTKPQIKKEHPDLVIPIPEIPEKKNPERKPEKKRMTITEHYFSADSQRKSKILPKIKRKFNRHKTVSSKEIFQGLEYEFNNKINRFIQNFASSIQLALINLESEEMPKNLLILPIVLLLKQYISNNNEAIETNLNTSTNQDTDNIITEEDPIRFNTENNEIQDAIYNIFENEADNEIIPLKTSLPYRFKFKKNLNKDYLFDNNSYDKDEYLRSRQKIRFLRDSDYLRKLKYQNYDFQIKDANTEINIRKNEEKNRLKKKNDMHELKKMIEKQRIIENTSKTERILSTHYHCKQLNK